MEVDEGAAPERFCYFDLKEALTARALMGIQSGVYPAAQDVACLQPAISGGKRPALEVEHDPMDTRFATRTHEWRWCRRAVVF
jgi:hypothetical protein